MSRGAWITIGLVLAISAYYWLLVRAITRREHRPPEDKVSQDWLAERARKKEDPDGIF